MNCLRDALRGWAGHRLGDGPSFLAAGEAIAGESALGEDHQLGAGMRRGFQVSENLLQILFRLEYLHVHLDCGDLHPIAPFRVVEARLESYSSSVFTIAPSQKLLEWPQRAPVRF